MNGTIVRVYAHWCGHCQAMQPEWNVFMKKIHNKINVMDIEESEMDKLTQLNESLKNPIMVHGYPTIAKIKNGAVSYFSGPRTSHEIMKWAVPKKLKSSTRKSRSKKTQTRRNKSSKRR